VFTELVYGAGDDGCDACPARGNRGACFGGFKEGSAASELLARRGLTIGSGGRICSHTGWGEDSLRLVSSVGVGDQEAEGRAATLLKGPKPRTIKGWDTQRGEQRLQTVAFLHLTQMATLLATYPVPQDAIVFPLYLHRPVEPSSPLPHGPKAHYDAQLHNTASRPTIWGSPHYAMCLFRPHSSLLCNPQCSLGWPDDVPLVRNRDPSAA
jgi:hypothetical protein